MLLLKGGYVLWLVVDVQERVLLVVAHVTRDVVLRVIMDVVEHVNHHVRVTV